MEGVVFLWTVLVALFTAGGLLPSGEAADDDETILKNYENCVYQPYRNQSYEEVIPHSLIFETDVALRYCPHFIKQEFRKCLAIVEKNKEVFDRKLAPHFASKIKESVELIDGNLQALCLHGGLTATVKKLSTCLNQFVANESHCQQEYAAFQHAKPFDLFANAGQTDYGQELCKTEKALKDCVNTKVLMPTDGRSPCSGPGDAFTHLLVALINPSIMHVVVDAYCNPSLNNEEDYHYDDDMDHTAISETREPVTEGHHQDGSGTAPKPDASPRFVAEVVMVIGASALLTSRTVFFNMF